MTSEPWRSTDTAALALGASVMMDPAVGYAIVDRIAGTASVPRDLEASVARLGAELRHRVIEVMAPPPAVAHAGTPIAVGTEREGAQLAPPVLLGAGPFFDRKALCRWAAAA